MFRATEYQLKAAYYASISREWRETHIRAVVAQSDELAEIAREQSSFYARVAADFYRWAREAMGVE